MAGTLGVLLYSDSFQVKVRVKVWYADSLDGIICLSIISDTCSSMPHQICVPLVIASLKAPFCSVKP